MQYQTRLFRQTTLMILAALLLCSCSLTSPAVSPTTTVTLPTTSEHWFAKDVPLPSTVDFYQLSATQQQLFLSYFNDPAQAALPAHQRLYRYLESNLANFNYEGRNTLASDTMTNMSGNCTSLALLVTALAKLVDVDVGYRASHAEPMLDFSANIVLSSAHVRSYLFEPRQEIDDSLMILQRSAIAVDYFPGRLDRLGSMLKAARFEAMIYNNLAADALVAGDLDRAYWLSRAALQRDASYSPSINLIAILYRRKGDLLASQQWYEFGMLHTSQPITLAGNYLVLAEQMQNQPLIDRLNQKLPALDEDNPYVWFYLAYQAEQRHHQSAAIIYYQKLLQKAPYLHKANLALAKLQFQQGDDSAARQSLTQALQYSYEPKNRALYQAKLDALQRPKQPGK